MHPYCKLCNIGPAKNADAPNLFIIRNIWNPFFFWKAGCKCYNCNKIRIFTRQINAINCKAKIQIFCFNDYISTNTKRECIECWKVLSVAIISVTVDTVLGHADLSPPSSCILSSLGEASTCNPSTGAGTKQSLNCQVLGGSQTGTQKSTLISFAFSVSKMALGE